MLSILEAKYNGNKYPIYISDNAINQLDLYLKDKNKKVIIICDECFKKKSFHVDNNFSKILKKYKVFYFKAGIKNKNFTYVNKIINFFFKNNISRDYFVVSIGGGVAAAGDFFLNAIQKHYDEMFKFGEVEIEISKLKNDAGMYGAAALVDKD